MESTPPFDFRRRTLFAGAVVAVIAGRAMAAARIGIVTVLGDSITAGLGLPAAQALPAQLQLALSSPWGPVCGCAERGSRATPALTAWRGSTLGVQADTDSRLVALGGNDLLQGVDPRAVQDNLTAIARRLKARRIMVVLAAMLAPPQIGSAYARDSRRRSSRHAREGQRRGALSLSAGRRRPRSQVRCSATTIPTPPA